MNLSVFMIFPKKVPPWQRENTLNRILYNNRDALMTLAENLDVKLIVVDMGVYKMTLLTDTELVESSELKVDNVVGG